MYYSTDIHQLVRSKDRGQVQKMKIYDAEHFCCPFGSGYLIKRSNLAGAWEEITCCAYMGEKLT